MKKSIKITLTTITAALAFTTFAGMASASAKTFNIGGEDMTAAEKAEADKSNTEANSDANAKKHKALEQKWQNEKAKEVGVKATDVTNNKSKNGQARTITNIKKNTNKILSNKKDKVVTYQVKNKKHKIRLYSSKSLKKSKVVTATELTSNRHIVVKKANGKKAIYRYSTKGWFANTNVKKISINTPKKSGSLGHQSESNTKAKLTQNVSNTNYNGFKNVKILRNQINRLGSIINNHPHAWDKTNNATTHESSLAWAKATYTENKSFYLNMLSDKSALHMVSQKNITTSLNQLNSMINKAKY